ncbi:MAG: hypothetical protein SRB1_02417 [Desulfobacteraceae bacterium Eth-SRB1]|nr:MAG: hypothetical protein SRB1_02417 [Desulfobacteraceae bacterium Eth-SRB1]
MDYRAAIRACPACPVASGNGTGGAPADGTGVICVILQRRTGLWIKIEISSSFAV